MNFYHAAAQLALPVDATRMEGLHRRLCTDLWLVSFMEYDMDYVDLEGTTLQPPCNPFGRNVLPMS
jgi:hypothetical protein